jgi:hypothetical protein
VSVFFFIKPLLLVLINTMINNFGVYKIFVELFIFDRDSPVYSLNLKGLREVNFSIIGLLPMGRRNHPLLICVLIIPLKAMTNL